MLRAPSVELGRPFGPYRIQRILGEGGMGIVYQALHTQRKKTVALKFLKECFLDDLKMRARFVLEAECVHGLQHPNIVRANGSDCHGPRPYIEMQLLTGERLSEYLGRVQKVPLIDVLRILSQLASALAHAHERSYVNRDLKPSNAMIVWAIDERAVFPSRVMLFDFGIARKIDSDPLTTTGHAAGTPHYMAPEARDALASRYPTPASDIFALGLVGYEMLTGERMLRSSSSAGEGTNERERFTLTTQLEEVPAAIRPLLDRMLHEIPGLRPSAVEVQQIADEFLAGRRGVVGAEVPTDPMTLGKPLAPLRPPSVATEEPVAEPQRPQRHTSLSLAIGESVVGPQPQPEPLKKARWWHAALIAGGLGVVVLVAVPMKTASRIRELHAKAIAAFPQDVYIERGHQVHLGEPVEIREAEKRAHPDWPPEIVDRQVEQTVDVDGFYIWETEGTWLPYLYYLNERLLKKEIRVLPDTKSGKPRYVVDLHGVQLVDLDPTVRGIEYDEATKQFKLVDDAYIWKPINAITPDGAKGFCEYYGWQLPTSRQWEYVANGGTRRLYPNGKDEHDPPPICEDAVIARNGDLDYPASRVCSYLNTTGPQDVRFPLGDVTNDAHKVKGMLGNVSEWVADQCTLVAEPGKAPVEGREYRGGNYQSDRERGMAGFKSCKPRSSTVLSDWATEDIGVRCVRY
jgi:serine/threonine protein kinase/formylglycine-generating enzyme required for sulfatase activity